MMHLYLISGEHPRLATGEIQALAGSARRHGRIVRAPQVRHPERLAYTRATYHVLFTATPASFLKKAAAYPWQRIYQRSFSVRVIRLQGNAFFTSKELAAIIWRSVRQPTVNLAQPATPVHVLVQGSRVYCCLLRHEAHTQFSSRRAHLRPGASATSLSPKLARCLVNLSGIKRGTVLDPFCGAGGILMEAGLMGLRVRGYDLDDASLRKCRQNLSHYGVTGSVERKDALTMPKARYVVTDLPYGRSSRMAADIYAAFFSVLGRKLQRRAVLVFPRRVQLPATTRLKLEHSYALYVHRSLTRHIMVVRK